VTVGIGTVRNKENNRIVCPFSGPRYPIVTGGHTANEKIKTRKFQVKN